MSQGLDLEQIKKGINSGNYSSNKSNKGKYKMFFFAMIPTVILGFITYLFYSNTVNFLNFAEATAEVVATVDDTRSYREHDKSITIVTAEVQDLELQVTTENGKKVNVPLLGLDRNTYKVGDKVEIYYSSSNYSDASLKASFALWKTSLILLLPLVLSIIFLIFGLLILFKG